MKINAKDINDRVFAEDILTRAENIYQQTLKIETDTIEYINSKMASVIPSVTSDFPK